MNKIFASKFSVLLNTLVPVAEVFVKRRSVSGNLPDAGRAALFTAFFMVSTFAHATATNTTYQSYTVGGITYNLVDLSVVGLAQTNLNALDPNSALMNFSNLSTGGVSTTCATGVTCVISTGNRNTNIPFEVTQAPNTTKIGGLFLNGGTAFSPPGDTGAPATAPQDSYTIQFSTPLGGQKSFYALTNTWWGNPSTTNEFNVTVNFTDGSSQVFQSLSGVDVRDFNYNPNTSQTISNTTKNWYKNETQWIDVRSFSLAPQNDDKEVQGITITQKDRPYSAGIIAGLSLSPYALTPANDITVTYNNLYNMVRNSSDGTITRSATLYNYFDNVMVDVSSKFDGGTLTNSTSGSTLQGFTVMGSRTDQNGVVRPGGGYINAAANRLDFRGNFSNDSSVASGTAGKMVIQNISNEDINYDTHVGTPKSSVGTVVLSGNNSAFNGGFLVQAGANLEISEARNLGAGVLNLVGTATTAATLSTTRDISIANNITVNGDPVFNVAAGTTTTITGNIADGTTATSGSNLLGDVVVSGGGTLNLQGINTYRGPTEVVANSTMRLSGSGSIGGGHYAANIINAGSLQFASGTTQEISGVVSGSGDLAQMGPGVLTLSAANTYTGPTNITGGTLNRLVNDQALAENMTLGPTLVWLDRAVSSLATLSGFALDAMNRDAGWRFLSLGRRMERLVLLTSALEVTVMQLQSVGRAGETQQPLEWLLDLTDSSGSFRSQTTGIASWQAVRDIVLLDSTSPRSLRFQIDGVRQALERLAQETGVSLVGLKQTSDRLNTWEAEGLPETPELQRALANLRLEMIALSDLLATRYFSVSEHAMTV